MPLHIAAAVMYRLLQSLLAAGLHTRCNRYFDPCFDQWFVIGSTIFLKQGGPFPMLLIGSEPEK